MTTQEALEKAESEVHVHREGQRWIVSAYDPEADAHRPKTCKSEGAARNREKRLIITKFLRNLDLDDIDLGLAQWAAEDAVMSTCAPDLRSMIALTLTQLAGPERAATIAEDIPAPK